MPARHIMDIMKLSLTMIVKDESDVIERVLTCAKSFCDEMIVTDTGSTDKSGEKAKNMGAKVFDFRWQDDFSAARNFAISKASGDYAIWLDADDFITDENCAKLLRLKRENFFCCDMIMLPYRLSENFSFFRERIFRLDGSHFFEGFVHETLPLKGKITKYDAEILHKKTRSSGDRNLRIYLAHDPALFGDRELYYFGRELYYNKRYEEAERVFDRFLSRGNFAPNLIDAAVLKYDCGKFLGNPLPDCLFAALKHGATPQLCCKIGDVFYEGNDFDNARFWYSAAMRANDMKDKGAFADDGYKALIPLLQLTMCAFKQNKKAEAKEFSASAYKLFPSDRRVIQNARYFGILSR